MAQGGEPLGQRADHVGETAGLGEGRDFGAEEENLERLHEGSPHPTEFTFRETQAVRLASVSQSLC